MKNNTVHIFYVRHHERLPDAVFGQLLDVLPPFFQAEINAYKHRESAQASLLGKILLAHALRKCRPEYTLQDIQTGPKERPFLPAAVDFNISHSGEYVIVAVGENAKVGVDIEKHRTVNPALFQKYFDTTEWQEISVSSNSLQTFFELWTIKESAIKCDGRGVEILSGTHKRYVADAPNTVICDTAEFHYQQMAISGNYACCVCSDVPFEICPEQVQIIDLL